MIHVSSDRLSTITTVRQKKKEIPGANRGKIPAKLRASLTYNVIKKIRLAPGLNQ